MLHPIPSRLPSTLYFLSPAFLSRQFSRLLSVLLPLGALVVAIQGGFAQIDSELPAYLEMVAEEQRVVATYEKVLDTVVCLESILEEGAASGSGTIVNKEGLILTAAHVVEGAKEVGVQMVDGTFVMADVLGLNKKHDVAMVKIRPEEGQAAKAWPFAEIGDSSDWKVTDNYIALGHAGGFDVKRPPPVRIGRAYNNSGDGDFIMTDCAVIGGDSGGPLFDLDGKLIGIHSFIGASLGENNHAPIHAVKDSWDRLLKGDVWGVMDMGLNLPVPGEDVEEDEAPRRKNIPFDEVDPDDFGRFLEKKMVEAIREGEDPNTVMEDPIGLLRDYGVSPRELRRVGEDDLLKLFMAASGDEGEIPFSEEALANIDIPKGLDVEGFAEDLMRVMERGELTLEDAEKLMVKNGADEKALEEMGDIEFSDMLNQMLGAPALTEQEKKDEEALMVQFERCLEGHQPAMEAAFQSTVGLFDRGNLLCHGVVVDPRGFILTKASEVKNAKMLTATVQGDSAGISFMGDIVKTWQEHDLALVFIDAPGLKAIQWEATLPPVGSYVASPNYEESLPIGIGLLAVGPRSLSTKNRPFLGIGLGFEDGHVVVGEVMEDSPAKAAELRENDLVLTINGKKPENTVDFIREVGTLNVGDELPLRIRRGDKEMDKTVVLGDRADIIGDEGDGPEGFDDFQLMNEMSGEMSRVRTGFPKVVQTDLPIEPDQMGGPLVDLRGKVLGLNIARAGRIETYAIQGSVILDLLAPLDFKAMARTALGEAGEEATPVPSKGEPSKVVGSEREAELMSALKAIKDARKALDDAERATKQALEALAK